MNADIVLSQKLFLGSIISGNVFCSPFLLISISFVSSSEVIFILLLIDFLHTPLCASVLHFEILNYFGNCNALIQQFNLNVAFPNLSAGIAECSQL